MIRTPGMFATVMVLLVGGGLMIAQTQLWDWMIEMPTGDALLIASAASRDEAGIERALAQGASIDARSNGCTALQFVAADGDLGLVKMLLERGANPDAYIESGNSALDSAAYTVCDPATIQVLLDAGANPNGGARSRPLVSATANQNAAVMEMLLESGAVPNLTGWNGLTALQAALEAGRSDLAQLLRRAGAV